MYYDWIKKNSKFGHCQKNKKNGIERTFKQFDSDHITDFHLLFFIGLLCNPKHQVYNQKTKIG